MAAVTAAAGVEPNKMSVITNITPTIAGTSRSMPEIASRFATRKRCSLDGTWELVWRNLLALLDEQEKLKWAIAFLVACSNGWRRILLWPYRTTESKGAAKR